VFRVFLISCAFVGLLIACAPFDSRKTEAGNWLAVLSNATPLEDAYYLPGYAYGPHERQKLDVYVPRAASNGLRPTVVFGYGGGFTDGNRDEYRFVGESFAGLGFVTVIYDYRLYPEVRFPSYLEDAALAVRWARDHAVQFGGDATRLILAGHSAGAFMAAMLGVNPVYLERVGLKPQDLSLVLCLSGAYSFYDANQTQHNGFISDDIAKVMLPATAETQPLGFITANLPRFLMVHGRQDAILPVPQARDFVNALRAAGDEVTYLEYDLDHASTVTTLARPLRPLSPVYNDLKRELQRLGLVAR
jgi:acetyl esterase/lipase